MPPVGNTNMSEKVSSDSHDKQAINLLRKKTRVLKILECMKIFPYKSMFQTGASLSLLAMRRKRGLFLTNRL